LKNLLISGFDNTSIAVHPYEANDRSRIIRVINLVCAECEWMSTKRFVPTFQWLHTFSETKCQSHLLLVAENASELVGWCRLFPEQCNGSGKIGELGIGLLANNRNQKIGSGLLELVFQWAQNSCMDRINLSVHRENRRALHVFGNFGFRYISDDRDRLLMSAKV
jgi:RimJ/RimL family protein N-acetyltransferase